MIRHAFIALIAGTAITFGAPLAAQYAQTPAAPQPSTVQPTPPAAAAQAGSSNAAAASEQGSNRSSSSAGSKPKICEATVIRAGPNQGQVINRCRRSDR